MFQRLDGVREANRCLWVALTPFILQKSRMRKRARTDLCGGRSAMIVPTATKVPRSGIRTPSLPIRKARGLSGAGDCSRATECNSDVHNILLIGSVSSFNPDETWLIRSGRQDFINRVCSIMHIVFRQCRMHQEH